MHWSEVYETLKDSVPRVNGIIQYGTNVNPYALKLAMALKEERSLKEKAEKRLSEANE